MLYLILAILFSGAMAVAVRITGEHSGSRYGVLLGNYATCVTMAFVLLPEKNLFPEGFGTAIGAGMVNGILFLAALVLMQINIEKNGAVLTAAFTKLGIVLPVLASILLLGETPSPVQTAGLFLVLAAILVLNMQRGGGSARAGGWLLVMLVVNGAADGMSKVFEQIGERRMDSLYLFYTFATALVLTLLLIVRERRAESAKAQAAKRIRLREVAGGVLVGIPNYVSTMFLLASVTRLPAYLVYPCFSVGTILTVSAVSILFLGDSLSRRQIWGCGLILAALVCLNI